MCCRPCNQKNRREFFWQVLVGATFLVCSLFIYYYLIYQGIVCSVHSPCSPKQKPISDALTSQSHCSSMCNTKECLDIAKFILGNMNQSANPCDDFYNFACGNFQEKFEREGNHSVLDQLTVELHIIIKGIIESSEAPIGTATHKLKLVYNSCMNTGSSELTAVQSILQFLKYMGIPNWPHLDANFTFKSPTLPEVLGRLFTYQENVFISFYESFYHSSEENSHLHHLSVAPQFHTFHEEGEVGEVKKVVSRILTYINVNFTEISKTLEEFIEMDAQIFNLYVNNSDFNVVCEEENATEMTFFDCTQTNYKDKNTYTLCRILESVIRNGRISSHYARDRLYVVCRFKHYVNQIFQLVSTYKDRAIANYIALRVFINNLKYMNFSVRKNMKLFIKLPTDSEDDYVTELDRWRFCVSWIADNMQYPLGTMYVNSMWPSKASYEVNEIFSQFLRATKNFVSQQPWIGDSTKEQILNEIEEEENCIYYVIDGMKNETKINELYRKFYPTRSSFMRNILNHKKFMFVASKLYAEDMRYFVEYSPFVVNAYGGDDIYLTFGILLPPVYKHGYPNLFNIAKIGQIIAHEIGHKLYYFFEYSTDLDNKTRDNFNQKKECLVDQYFNFRLEPIQKHVRGNMTISENFPDNMGIEVTEKVAEMYLRDMENNLFTLPGLSYSSNELLYISYAQMWCSVRSIEKQREHYERDFHSPPEFRIKGALQNSKRFSEVFNCPKTSFMNAEKKCSVFD